MSNLTDALIAAKLIGGSGGSGGGSGLPPITTETTTIVEEQTVTGFQNMGGSIYIGMGGAVDFSDLGGGDAVDVVFDGVTYHTQVVSIQGISAIGNAGIMGDGEDTGEPFALTDVYQPNTLAVITNQAGTSHTVEASASVSSPKNGSILIVKDGEWATEELSTLIPIAICTIMASGTFTVPAGSSYTASDLPISQTVGVPAGWTKGVALAVTQATNGNHNVTDALVMSADFDFENSEISFITFYNPTSSSISFSGLVFMGGIAKNA